jgi:hypothetical protein
MKHYVLQVLIAFDQLLCALIGGWADESLSSYAWRLERDGKWWGRLWRPVTDWFFYVITGQVDHCYQSYLAERNRAHVPPELRVQ